jgi:hypothetical protein
MPFSRKFDVVVVYSTDRLGRSVKPCLDILESLKAHRTDFISIKLTSRDSGNASTRLGAKGLVELVTSVWLPASYSGERGSTKSSLMVEGSHVSHKGGPAAFHSCSTSLANSLAVAGWRFAHAVSLHRAKGSQDVRCRQVDDSEKLLICGD